jgi:hypothetical protein
MARSRGRVFLVVVMLHLLCKSMILAEMNQRAFEEEEDEALLVRKERQNSAGFNSLVNLFGLFANGFQILGPTNISVSNATTFLITPAFWSTLLNLLQYLTFIWWFASVLFLYVFGVAVLYLFSIVHPLNADDGYQGAVGGASAVASASYSNPSYSAPSSSYGYSSLFRSFEDENMPLFDKVTSVGYGFLDRTSELYNLIQTPACKRYAMCHLSATLGDQEANGFIFKDLFRALSSTLDNKAGLDGMTRSVNVGLLTGDCDEPIMSCPELQPYFKKVSETWSNYL